MSSRKRILAHPAVEEMWQEEPHGRTHYEAYDGDYWVGLHNGWCCPLMECHTIHEATLKEVWDMVVECVPCACIGCQPENPERLQGCCCAWDQISPTRTAYFLHDKKEENDA
jgi:hypothetical protein